MTAGALLIAAQPLAGRDRQWSLSAPVGALGGREVTIEKRWAARPASLGLENAYRDLLREWANGSPQAIERYAELQALVTERFAGTPIRAKNYGYEEVQRGLRCVAAIETNTIENLAAVDGDLLLVVSAFHLGVFEHLMRRLGLHWLAGEDWQRLETLRRLYRDRRDAPAASEEYRLAALQITIGATLEQIGLIGALEKARSAFELATRFSPDDEVPRYWVGFLSEKFGDYRRARSSFGWLLERAPGDFESGLRLALAEARSGGAPEGAQRLRALVESTAPDWIRVIAGQELARGVEVELPAEAVRLLQRTRTEFPSAPTVTVQLAELLGDGVEESEALLEEILGLPRGREPSPRLLYEEARTEGLEARVRSFGDWISSRFADLVEAIDTIEKLETVQGALRRHGSARVGDFRTGFENPNRERPVFEDCDGFKMPKK
ncbi:MAG: tetratricopeptide repeat protein [Thermoanaerobaculia bacterium]